MGINKEVNNPIKYISNNSIAYTAGNNLLFYNTDEEKQTFNNANEKTSKITAMAVTHNRKYLAIAEMSDYPSCSVYDLYTQKFKSDLHFRPKTECKYYSCIAFAKTNDKLLLTLTGPPDNQLILWSFEKKEAVPLVHIDLNHEVGRDLSFNPMDHNNLVVLGDGVFRNYKYINDQLKSVHSSLKSNNKNLSNDFRCHTWVVDKENRETYLLLGTAKGEIILLDHTCEFKKICEGSPMKHSLECMEVYSKGMVLVGEHSQVYIYDKTSNDLSFLSRQPTRTIECDLTMGHNLIYVAVSPKEDKLAMLSSNGQLVSLDLNKLATEYGKPDFQYMIQPFHSHEIYCIDVCMRKQNVATLSGDMSLRIYDYKNLKLEYLKTFEEKPIHLSYHPNGLYIVICLSSKVQLYVLQAKSIEMIREYAFKEVTCAKFSNGGHLIAIANKNNIEIKSVWYDFNIGYLSSYKGHTSKVDSLHWSYNDSFIYFSDTQGYLSYFSPYLTKKKESSKEGITKDDIFNKKGTLLNNVFLSYVHSKMFIVTNDLCLYELSTSDLEKKDKPEIQLPVNVSRVLVNKTCGVVLLSVDQENATGSVIIYSYPIDTRNNSRKVEISGHLTGIEDMCFSSDEQFLFTAGKDNCLMIWNVKEREVNYQRDKDSTLPWSTELLISAEAKKAQQDKKRTLNNDIQENKYENEKKIDVQRLNFQNRLSELRDNKSLEIDDLEHRYQDLVKKKLDQTTIHGKEMDKIINTNEKAKSEKENQLELQWQSKKNEISRLNEEIRRLDMSNNDDLRVKEERYNEELSNLNAKHDEVILTLSEDISKRKVELKEMEEYNRQEVIEVESLHTKEYQQYKQQEEKGVQDDKDRNNQDKGLIAFNRKKIKELNEEQTKLSHKNEDIANQSKVKHEHRKALESEINKLTEKRREKDQEIKKKEDKIQELKRKNFELEKFRKVLDYKISEDKARIGPKEAEIRKYKGEISKLNESLKDYNKENTNLGSHCEKLKTKQEEMGGELTTLRIVKKEESESIQRIKKELMEIVNLIQFPEEMSKRFYSLYKNLVGSKRSMERNPGLIDKELENQVQFLQDNQSDLAIQLDRLVKAHEIDKTKKMMENRELIKQINKLREQLDKSRKSKGSMRATHTVYNKTGESFNSEQEGDLKEKYNHRIKEKQKQISLIESFSSEINELTKRIEFKSRQKNTDDEVDADADADREDGDREGQQEETTGQLEGDGNTDKRDSIQVQNENDEVNYD